MVLSQLNEEEFYNKLSNYLKLGKFKEFTDLINQSPELDIHVNPKLIPYRFEYISELILNNLKIFIISPKIEI